MKTLVVYYSRTGRTKKIAEYIQSALDSEIEEIQDVKNRNGVLGWLSAGRDAGSKSLTSLEEMDKMPVDYNVVILGSPTWNNSLSSPVRTYIEKFNEDLRHVACFSTGDGEDPDAVDEMEALLGRKVFAKLHLVRKSDIDSGNYQEKVDKFVSKIKSFML